jgi:predicted Rossmann-fold nucleotide-binding protein
VGFSPESDVIVEGTWKEASSLKLRVELREELLSRCHSMYASFLLTNYYLVYGGGTVGLMGENAKTLVALSRPDAAYAQV